MENNNIEEAATASKTREGTIYILMKDKNIYIGSTIQDLKKRIYTHKRDSKIKTTNYIIIFESLEEYKILIF
jgi:predicted GIY-YIG superfamily endonuclease